MNEQAPSNSLSSRLRDHATLHDDLRNHSTEQAQWGDDLHLAAAAIERLQILEGEYATFRKCAAADVKVLQLQIDELEIRIERQRASLRSALDARTADEPRCGICSTPIAGTVESWTDGKPVHTACQSEAIRQHRASQPPSCEPLSAPDDMDESGRNGHFENYGYVGTASGHIVRDGTFWVATFRTGAEADQYVELRNEPASAPPQAAEQPSGYLHQITEPDGRYNIMYSASGDNPWSHWLQQHRDKCQYQCTPLYARPAQPPGDNPFSLATAQILEAGGGNTPKLSVLFRTIGDMHQASRFVENATRTRPTKGVVQVAADAYAENPNMQTASALGEALKRAK